jgi:hypothetical protein
MESAMKLHYYAAALIIAAFAASALAVDKAAPASDQKIEVKAAPKAPGTKPHSHLEDRQGIVAVQPVAAQSQSAKKPLHNHAKFHKQQ